MTFPSLPHKAERLKVGLLEAINSLGHPLLLDVIEVLFGDSEDVVGVDLRSVTHVAVGGSGRFDFDCVDVVEHLDVVDVDVVSHRACQEAC